MTINTSIKQDFNTELMQNYYSALVNKFFKILPMMENGEDTVEIYIESLQAELLGCKSLIHALDNNPLYLSLLSVLEWLRVNVYNDSFSFKRKRREIFNAISICKKLESNYTQPITSVELEVMQ